MKRILQQLCLLLVLLISLAVVSGCIGEDDNHGHGDATGNYAALNESALNQIKSGEKILVAVSVVPQSEFVEKVGGDKVVAISMIPQGAGHHYDPSPRQIEDLSNANMYVALGSGEIFETTHMNSFTQINPTMKIVNSSAGIKLIVNGNTSDPHVWTSPKNAQIMVENICEGLAELDPANATYYEQNRDNYLTELTSLDSEVSNELSNLSNRNFMVYHPAWSYFAKDYQLNQIAAEIDGKEPTPKTLSKFIDLAKENNITVIFVQEQVSKTSAEAIAESVGAEVFVVDPLAKDYVNNTKYVANALAENLS
ncbi:metal ABC transporter solute-binding protein, Zn/Mn family [Methanolapillus millepedarum]|uniref:metal ABC transporter solute-binding protein, Zn/Mn family n=1 Tax=Methanolapillus millepedarum TaxID=3028296 RepID=UPI0030B90A92